MVVRYDFYTSNKNKKGRLLLLNINNALFVFEKANQICKFGF